MFSMSTGGWLAGTKNENGHLHRNLHTAMVRRVFRIDPRTGPRALSMLQHPLLWLTNFCYSLRHNAEPAYSMSSVESDLSP
jgi:hypothetical protein